VLRNILVDSDLDLVDSLEKEPADSRDNKTYHGASASNERYARVCMRARGSVDDPCVAGAVVIAM
jgi:hypothetical protein